MKRTRWVFGAAAVAGVVVLVAPAVGQGKAASASLKWSLSRGGPTITSDDFGTVDGRSRVSGWFRLGSSSSTKSGKLAIALTGSSAFSITDDRCTGKSIGRKLSCWVRVAYVPFGAPPSGSATLVATGDHGSFADPSASLSLSEQCSDTAAHHVYWGSVGNESGVKRVPVGGGCVTTLASDYDAGYPVSLAVDSTHVYWADLLGGMVKKVPLGGGEVTVLASGQFGVASVAVDGTHVYWVNRGTYPNYDDGTVNEVPVGGGSVATLASGQSFPSSVAVDGTHVYWVDSGHGYWITSGDGTVNKVPLGGGPVTTLASGQSYPNSVAVDGTHVYWTNRDVNTVNEVPLGGGSVTTLADGQFGVVAVAVDGTNAYWGNYGSRTVSEVPLGGGAANGLAGSAFAPSSLAVDGKNVYWASANGDPNSLHGAVSQVPISGYPTTTLASGDWWAEAVAIGP